MRVTQVFIIFIVIFLCFLSFWFRGFVFEWDLNQACETRWCLQAVAGEEIYVWAARFEKYTERNGWANGECALEVSGPRLVLLTPWLQGWGGGVKCCWNRCSSNFSYPNNFKQIDHQNTTLCNNNLPSNMFQPYGIIIKLICKIY